MKAAKSWSLRDVDEHTRSALLKAAEKSGLSVNDWLGTEPQAEGQTTAQPRPAAAVEPPAAAAAPGAMSTMEEFSASDDPSLEVREAIGRLTARLGVMDDKARAAVAGLPARLAEVENRLAYLVEARLNPDERMHAMSGAAAMIDVLVRDIDGAALRASAFGVRPTPGFEIKAVVPPAETTPAPRLVAPPPPAVAPLAAPAAIKPAAKPAPGMSPAAEQLSDIRFQLDALLADEPGSAQQPPPRAAPSPGPALRTSETRVDKAEPQAATPPPAPPAPASQSGAADHLHRLEVQLREIMTRLPAKKDADLASAIREISVRQKTIDDRADATAMRREQKTLSDTVKSLHSEMAALGARVASVSRNAPADSATMADLAKRIDALAADRPVDRTLLNGIRADLDQLRASLGDSSVRDAIGELHARYADMAGRVDRLIEMAPGPERLDALGGEIAAIRRAVENADRGLSERLEARLEEVARSAASTANRPMATPPVSVDLSKLEQRFDSLAKTVSLALSRAPVSPGATDDAREFARRLDDIAAGIGRLAEKTDAVTTESPTVAALEGRLGQMAANINGLLSREATGQPSPIVEKIKSKLEAIAEGVDSLFMGMPPSEANTVLQRIDQRFDKLAGQMGSLAPAGLTRLESRLDQIASDLHNFGPPQAGTNDEAGLNRKLDQIADSLADIVRRPRPSESAEIESLHSRLADIADRIEQIAVPENHLQSDLDEIRTEVASIRAVHQRLQTLTERIDSIAAVQHQPLLAIAEIRDGIGAIRSMHDRIQSITDRLDRLSAAQRDPVPAGEIKAGFAAIRSMQEQLQALRDSLGAQPASVDASSAAEMRSGVAAIAAVHEEMRSLAGQISGMAVQRAPVAVLEDIKKDIVAIRTEVAARPRMSSTEPLEKLVSELAKQVSSVSRTPSDPGALTALANRVTALAGELEEAKPRVQQLEEIEARMARLQASLADTRTDSVEAAKAEARAVVTDLSRMVASGDVDPAAIGALVQDIESLKNTSGDSDRRLRTKLDAMSTTLAQVVARLTQLEGEATRRAAGGEPLPAAKPVDWPAPAARTEVTSLPPPLPPMMEDEPAGPPARTSRADFIAAARRAAQAAAEESARPPGGEGRDGDKPNVLARFSQAILNRKRTLLLAAAAVVLAVGALQIFAGRLGGAAEMARVAPTAHAAPVTVAVVDSATTAAVPAAPTRVAAADTAAATPTAPSVPVPQSSSTAGAPILVAPAAFDRDLAFAAPVYQQQLAAPHADMPPVAPPALSAPAASNPPAASVQLASAGTADLAAKAPSSAQIDPAIGSGKLVNAALNGDASAAFEVAARYAAGSRVARDPAKAAQWYQRAADGGVLMAAFRLGSLYERGDGVPQDLGQALTWYQRAADHGNVNAMYNLAVLLSQGFNGAPADPKLALKWFIAAANYDLRDSQYNLGVIYVRGIGTSVNLAESYKWFALAARDGDADATARRDEVARSLSPSEIAQGQAAVANWHAKQPIVEANAVTQPAGGWDSDLVSDSDRAALVKTIQTLLTDQGYDPGPADGRVGPKTKQAVKDYQHKSGIAETGQIDTTLLASLTVASH